MKLKLLSLLVLLSLPLAAQEPTLATSADLAALTPEDIGASKTGDRDYIQNAAALAPLYREFQALNNPTPGSSYIGITCFGDSMCAQSYTPGYIAQQLEARYGCGAILSPNLGFSWNGASWTYGGGASHLSTNYGRLPGANEINIPVGGTAAITFPGTSGNLGRRASGGNFGLSDSGLSGSDTQFNLPRGIRKVTVYYVKSPGYGTLDVTLAQPGAANQTASVSTDAAEALGKVDITPTNRAGAMTVTLAASVADCRVLGVVWWGSSGVIMLQSNVGGSSMQSQLSCLSGGAFKTIYQSLLSELNVKAVFHLQRAEQVGQDWQANYGTFFDAYAALGKTQIVFGEPYYPGQPTDVVDAFLREACRERNYAFYDRRAVAIDADITALAWNDDIAHLDGSFHRYDATMFLTAVNDFDCLAGRQSRPPWIRRDTDALILTQPINAMRTETLRGATGISTETASKSGVGYDVSVNNERGFRALHGSVEGYAVARIGFVSTNTTSGHNTATIPLAFTGTGYRNLGLKDSSRGFLVFGTSSTTLTTLTGLTQKCYGLEFMVANGTDQPHLTAGLACVRMFACDGTTVTTSPWAQAELSPAASTGFRFALIFDPAESMLFLICGTLHESTQAGAPRLQLTLPMPAMSSSVTAGQWIQLGVESTGAAPATTGEISFKEIRCISGFAGGMFY